MVPAERLTAPSRAERAASTTESQVPCSSSAGWSAKENGSRYLPMARRTACRPVSHIPAPLMLQVTKTVTHTGGVMWDANPQ